MNNLAPVRVGVIGTGSMGSNHARVYSGLKDAKLIAVVDSDLSLARKVSNQVGGRPYCDWSEIVDLVDAVSVAVPSFQHAEVAVPLLEAGIHCLVEKPLAPSPTECEAIIGASNSSGALLMVGHIERFNPAVQALSSLLDGSPEHIFAIEASRRSALSARISDVDVVTDLMIHDLDVITYLLGEEVVQIEARSPPGPSGNSGDFASAMLTFGSGKLACLTASRVTQNHVRTLQVTTENRLLALDYSSQELLICRQGRLAALDGQTIGGDFVLDLRTERVMIQHQEPLVRELSAFLNAIRHDEASPVSGRTALDVMDLVWTIRKQIAQAGAK
jgi:virulence factor